MLRGIFELIAIIVGPVAALVGVKISQGSSERAAASHEEGETERLRQQLSAERASRQLDALRAKRRGDAVALHGWLTRFQARLDAQYLQLSQILTPPNPKLAEHIAALLSPPLPNAAEMGLDVVLIPVSSPELRRRVRELDKWGGKIQATLPSITAWLSAHPAPWDEKISAEWWDVCRPFLDLSEDRDDRYADLAQLMEAYELGLDLD